MKRKLMLLNNDKHDTQIRKCNSLELNIVINNVNFVLHHELRIVNCMQHAFNKFIW
jgi:hypothetical protein